MKKQIIGYEGLYEIDKSGNVYSLRYKRPFKILTPAKTRTGYLIIRMQKNKKQFGTGLHTLLAKHFIENPNGYKEVNHIDGNKLNNSLDNLEWCTHSENIRHADRIGLRKMPKGSKHANAIINEKIAKEIKEKCKVFYYGLEAKLAKEYNVTRWVISDIRRNKSWKEV